MNELKNISVVLPSLDPDEKLTKVIDGLLEYGFTDIILVNDGSKQENLHYFTDAAAAHPEITLLHHEVNRGKGAALKTAFTWFLANRPEGKGVVTVDGDNQHHPEDTRNCALHMLEANRLVLGVRDFDQPHVPARSRQGNHITSFVFKVFVGMACSDTQTGLRAIPRHDLETLNAVAGERFEYETNMLLEMNRLGIAFDEVKIRTVYIEENKSSHFRVVRDSWRIYKLILSHFFRYRLWSFLKYSASSLVSAIVDEGVFALLGMLLNGLMQGLALTVVSTAGARIISSLINFFMNKRLVFQSGADTTGALLRYYALAIPMLFAQAGLTQLLCALLGIADSNTGLRAVIYAIVMVVLFIVSFTVQKKWVFAKKDSDQQ